jgi:GTPase SAR1 family protein
MLDDDNMGVDAPQNLWQKILSDFSIRTKLPIVNLLVIGDHESGKTALLTKLKESSPTLHQAPPPQSGGSISTLEYTTINIMDPKALKGGGAIEATGELLRNSNEKITSTN